MVAKINSLTIGNISGGTFIFGNVNQVCPVTSTESNSQTGSGSNSRSNATPVSGSQNSSPPIPPSSPTTPTPNSESGNTL
ncbi:MULTISPECIES: hypothetical protein [Priestia]|jgi:hypothetical protein|uniref:hypothetical protein n=1 Tax=Priestia TaxID=2800373 RepID=UPI002040DE7B|nr:MULTISPECIES: hypothetical protein [Priestia]MCM3772931.1 hypothetical protein [Priestia aryabhattai]MDY0941672.1 hypothetical protein [Priestia megaterium]